MIVPATSWPRIIGSLQPHHAEAAVIVVVQVGSADAAGLDGNGDLAGAGLFFRPFLDPEVLCGVDHH